MISHGITTTGLALGSASMIGAIVGSIVGLATVKAYDLMRTTQRKGKNSVQKKPNDLNRWAFSVHFLDQGAHFVISNEKC